MKDSKQQHGGVLKAEVKVEEEEEMDISSSESEEESSSEEESTSEDEESPKRRGEQRKKKFVVPPPRELPNRTTRGQRIGNLGVEEDEDADEEFWNQDFFAEEAKDEAYETESEPEDRFDADFMESEDESEEDEDAEELAVRAQEKKKKVLRPPGYKQQKKPTVAKEAPSSLKKKSPNLLKANVDEIPAERTMSVRNSTRLKLEEAQDMRKMQEEMKPKKVTKPVVHKQLTQAELLAEAARTEIENTRSLEYLVAVEEENKRKATAARRKYVGPMICYRSRKGEDGYEHTTLEVRNMKTPEYLEPMKAPTPPEKDVCVITKKVAKYRDPLTGQPYADIAAFKALRAHVG